MFIFVYIMPKETILNLLVLYNIDKEIKTRRSDLAPMYIVSGVPWVDGL